MNNSRERPKATFADQTWPQGYLLSRLISRAAPAALILILRRLADDTFHWQASGDPVGPFDLESEAIADADAAHYNVFGATP